MQDHPTIELTPDELRVLSEIDGHEPKWIGAHVVFLCQREGCDATVIEELSPSIFRVPEAPLPEGWGWDDNELALHCPTHRS